MKVFVEENDHDLPEVGYKCPVNGPGVISSSVPHTGEGVCYQVHNGDT